MSQSQKEKVVSIRKVANRDFDMDIVKDELRFELFMYSLRINGIL